MIPDIRLTESGRIKCAWDIQRIRRIQLKPAEPKRREAAEMSGTEHRREIARRLRQKRRQLLAKPFGLGGMLLSAVFRPGNE
jgi:hypothetical protein